MQGFEFISNQLNQKYDTEIVFLLDLGLVIVKTSVIPQSLEKLVGYV